MYTPQTHAHKHMLTHTLTRTRTRTHTFTHVCVLTHTCTHAHTHTPTDIEYITKDACTVSQHARTHTHITEKPKYVANTSGL